MENYCSAKCKTGLIMIWGSSFHYITNTAPKQAWPLSTE